MRFLPYLAVACLLLLSACATTNSRVPAEAASETIPIPALNEGLKGYRVTLFLRDGHRYDVSAPEITADSTFFTVIGPFYEVSGPARDRHRAVATSEVERIVRRPNTSNPLIGGIVGVALGTFAYFRTRRAAEECDADNCVGAALSVGVAAIGIPISGLLGIFAGAVSEGESEVYWVVVERSGGIRIVK